MPTLIFRGEDGNEQKVELASELSVGREAGNDVVLSDKGVSRQHCRFFVDEGGAVWVEDLGSANGVLVGGERIGEATEVPDGVEVVVGGCRVTASKRRATQARPAARAPGRNGARPGALAKAEPGQPVKRATRMMAAGEAPQRARPAPRAGPSGRAEARPVLHGMAGPFSGQAFELNKGKLLVGRVPPADVLLDDDSVSRRHAEILKTGARFSVRDLGSANGTFVNGDRVSEAPIQPGDVVRFGVVELSFAGPGGGRADAGGGKKKLLIGVGAGVFLLLVVGVLVGGGGGGQNNAHPGPGPQVPVEPPAEDPQRLMGQCTAFADPETESYNLEQCAKVCTKVHELDPTMGANKKVKFCKKELENEKKLEEARIKVATTQEEEAVKILQTIDQGDAIFPRAKTKFDEAVRILVQRYRSQCKSDVNGGHFESGYTGPCLRALELTCNNVSGPDVEIVKLFENAARNLGRGKGEYKCPPEYAKFQKVIPMGDQLEVMIKTAFAAKYPKPELAEIMLRYYQTGRAKQAADELKRLRSKWGPKERQVLTDLIQPLDIIDGGWASVQEYIRLGRAKDAEERLKPTFEADQKIVATSPDPSKPFPQSFLMRDIHTQMAKIYLTLAREELQKERWNKAFDNVYKGYKHDPKNTELANYIARMEREANRGMSESPGCESYLYALDITGPDSSVHKKAKEEAEKAGCSAP